MGNVTDFLDGAADRHVRSVWLSPDPDQVDGSRSLADGSDPRESAWRFDIGSVGRTIWQAMVDANQPTDEQREAAEAEGLRMRFDPEGMAVSAIAACLRAAARPGGDELTFDRPTMSDGEVQVDPDARTLTEAMWDMLPIGETERLWAAVLKANVTTPETDRLASFGAGSPTTRSGAQRAD